MRLFINNIRQYKIIRYISVGGFSYIFELSVLFFLVEIAHLSETLSVSISFWFGLTTAFLLQKIFAFNNKSHGTALLGKQVFLYALLIIWNYAFTIVLVSSISPIMGLFITRTLALIITTAWNYLIYSRFIFR